MLTCQKALPQYEALSPTRFPAPHPKNELSQASVPTHYPPILRDNPSPSQSNPTALMQSVWLWSVQLKINNLFSRELCENRRIKYVEYSPKAFRLRGISMRVTSLLVDWCIFACTCVQRITCLLSAPSGVHRARGPGACRVESSHTDHVGGVASQVLQLHRSAPAERECGVSQSHSAAWNSQ